MALSLGQAWNFVRRDADSLRLPRLSPARAREEYRLHLAALEWSLDSPILIQGEQDLKSKRFWQDRVEPFEHQIQNLITFCRRAPVALIADDVGLGKTISAGLIVSELMARRKVSRTLVVCPKMLLPQWAEEMRSKFGIDALGESGVAFRPLVRSSVPIVITTYHTMRSCFKEIREANFDMVILDEAHKLKNLYGTPKPPEFAVTIQGALRERVFKYVLMLTATPIQMRLWDLYSLIDLLAVAKGHANPLGTKSEFSARYLLDGSAKAVQLHPGRKKEFRDHLSNYMVRTRRTDCNLVFPERQVHLQKAPASNIEQQLIALTKELFREEALSGLEQSSIAKGLMSSPEALCSELYNHSRVPSEYAERAKKIAGVSPRTGKLEQLNHVIQNLRESRPNDWRLVVFTTRKETQEAIGRYLKEQGAPYGFIRGGSARENDRVIKQFWCDPPGLNVIVSTDAGAEGINLQVANVLVNYDLPWNPMVVEQRIGRIQRLAAKHASVIVLNLVVAGSVEEDVVDRLTGRLQAISESMGDIESVLGAAGGGMDDEEGMEAIIRKLVVDSLLGQDIEAATQKAVDSIELGKRIFEEQKETVEQTIGTLNSMHRTGPKMPTIKPLVPSVPYEEFVRSALKAEGCALANREDRTVEVRRPGRPPETIAFSEEVAENSDGGYRGVFTQQGPRLYRPGKPAFERLAQSWADRHEAHVIRFAKPNEQQIKTLAAQWTMKIDGAAVVDLQIQRTEDAFQGELICRANAAVAHDKLERLVGIAFKSHMHPLLPPCDTFEKILCNDDVYPQVISDNIRHSVAESLEADPDLAEFCRFYSERLSEELVAAGSQIERQNQVRNQYSPNVRAEAVAIDAIRYDVVSANAIVELLGCRYESALTIVPALNLVSSDVPLRSCEKTGLSVPETWLETCSVSKGVGLRHLFGRSDESGRIAFPEFLLTCQYSGKKILSDESAKSDVSQRLCAKSLLRASAVSRRLGLPDELVSCEFTNAIVLESEAEVSKVSGKRFRADERAQSMVSGISGHQSEFIKSSQPVGFLIPDEAGRSDFSGEIGPLVNLEASARPPHRRGFATEIVQCQETGKRLLRDEVAISVVSGRQVDKSLLVRSDVSGKMGLQAELLRCEQSGRLLVPDETAYCKVSGKRVCTDLLKRSQDSGRFALESLMVQCEVSKKLVLPDEVERCQLTGTLSLRDNLETCVATNKRILRSRMVSSVASGKWFWNRADDKAPALAGSSEWPSVEILRCAWLGGPMLASEAATCQICKLVLANSLMNAFGEFSIFRDLLDGRNRLPCAEEIGQATLHWLRKNVPEFERAKDGMAANSPGGDVQLVCCRTSSGFLGLRHQYVGAIFKLGPGRTLLCGPFVGRRIEGMWTPVADR